MMPSCIRRSLSGVGPVVASVRKPSMKGGIFTPDHEAAEDQEREDQQLGGEPGIGAQRAGGPVIGDRGEDREDHEQSEPASRAWRASCRNRCLPCVDRVHDPDPDRSERDDRDRLPQRMLVADELGEHAANRQHQRHAVARQHVEVDEDLERGQALVARQLGVGDESWLE
jgi:hypothetical protein